MNKAAVKKNLPPIIMENNILDNNKDDNFIDNSVSTTNMNINKYLKMQIDEKMKKIEDLSISQDINKKTLTELLQKLNIIIKSNAELLYSGVDPNNEKKENDNKKDKEKRIKELNLILENKKRELNQSKETNKNFKNKYENMMKEDTTSSLSKIDDFQKKINNIKNNNIELNKKINLLNYNNHLKGKQLDLKSKNRDKKEIKIYSDEYATIMKEKYSQFAKLNANKKLIKDIVEQFQYLIKLLNNEDNKKEKEKENEKNSERNCFIKGINLKMKEDINNLREDLSGNEDNIYNRIITDKTIILGNYNKINNKQMPIINKNKSIKKLKIGKSLLKNINENENKSKRLIKSQSCNDILVKDKLNINVININYNEINYDTFSNSHYEKIVNQRQKYYNLDERLDKSIKDLSLFYENKIKDINTILDLNSKKLSNIQQENELLKSKITDLRRILELNIKEQRLLKQNLRYKNNNLSDKNIDKQKDIENKKEKLEIDDIEKNIETKNKISKEDYIDMLKEKYKVKNKVSL